MDVDWHSRYKLKAAIQGNREDCMQMRLIWISHSYSAVWIIVQSFVGWISSNGICILLTNGFKTTNLFSCQNGKIKNSELNLIEKEILSSRMKREMHGHVKGACKLRLREASLKDAQWHEHRSLQPTVLPLGHSAYTSINLSTLPFFLSLSPFFPFIRIASKPQTLCCTLSARISEPHAAFRPALPSVYIRHKNTEPAMYFGLHCGSEEHKQPLAPSWKWFYSFNIISLNNDSAPTLRGCR